MANSSKSLISISRPYERIQELETALGELLGIILNTEFGPIPQVEKAQKVLNDSGVKCRI